MRSPVRQGRCHRLTRAFYPPQKHDPIFIHGGAPKAHGVYCGGFAVLNWRRRASTMGARFGLWHVGQRGSQQASTRAIARRAVMKESGKCRSGRARDRSGLSRPLRRGGEMPHAFADDERVAAENDGDVVIPAREAAALEVVETKLAFEIFVRPFNAPSLLDDANELPSRGVFGHRSQHIVRRVAFTFGPLDEQPLRCAPLPVGVLDPHPHPCELGAQRLSSPFTPGHLSKRLGRQTVREFGQRLRLSFTAILKDSTYDRRRLDVERVVETCAVNTITKLSHVAVRGITEQDSDGKPRLHGGFNHVERDTPLGPKDDFVRDPRPLPKNRVAGPRFRQIQLHIDGQLLCCRAHRQADADLTVGRLAGRSRVLTLHSDRMLSLLEKTRVVHDPCTNLFAPLHRAERVPGRQTTHRLVLPIRTRKKRQHLVVHLICRLRVRAGTSGDRLSALAFAFAQDPERVDRKRRSTTPVPENLAYLLKVVLQPSRGGLVQLVAHAPRSHMQLSWANSSAVVLRSEAANAWNGLMWGSTRGEVRGTSQGPGTRLLGQADAAKVAFPRSMLTFGADVRATSLPSAKVSDV